MSTNMLGTPWTLQMARGTSVGDAGDLGHRRRCAHLDARSGQLRCSHQGMLVAQRVLQGTLELSVDRTFPRS